MLVSVLTNATPRQDPQSLLSEMLPWLILLLGVVIAGGVVIFWVKRSMEDARAGSKGDSGFTLHELRELHGKGEISDEEFERARAAIIGQFQSKQTENETDAAAPNDEPESDNDAKP